MIQSKAATKEYRENFDRIFNKASGVRPCEDCDGTGIIFGLQKVCVWCLGTGKRGNDQPLSGCPPSGEG